MLFRLIGPSRTRLVAQILAAIIGAGFVIALQVAAIRTENTLARFAGDDMSLVNRVSDRVIALNYGRVIAMGSPSEVQRHPDVVAAYLGA